MNTSELAETLYQDCKNLIPFSKAKKVIIDSRREGYMVQDAFLKLKQINGEGSIAGWKVALTNIEMQKLTGISEPAEGAIFDPLIYRILF